MLEYGLKESASYTPERLLSPTLKVMKMNSVDEEDFLEVHYTTAQQVPLTKERTLITAMGDLPEIKEPETSENDMFNIKKITHASPIQTQHHVITTQPTRIRYRSEPAVEISTSVKSLQRSFSLPEEERTVTEVEAEQQLEDLLEAEDCFNWDEDKLLLEIDDSLASDSDSKSSRSPRRDLDGDNAAQEEYDVGVLDDNKDGVVSRDSSDNSISSSSSARLSITAFKDKFSSPLRSKAKSSPQHSPTTDLKENMMPPATSALVTDEFGFPLSIFTKVSTVFLCIISTNIQINCSSHLLIVFHLTG